MSTIQSPTKVGRWGKVKQFLFKAVFIYFILFAFPLDWKYYQQLFSAKWTDLHFQDIFLLTTYTPRFVHTSDWGIASFANWLLIAVIALLGAGSWTYIGKSKLHNNTLYYWLRVLLRYRLAAGIIGYGILQVSPLLLPYPSISDLNNNYGDYLPWKAYALSAGVAGAAYETSLGLIQVIGGLLLLSRKTVTIGAGIITAVLINVVVANFAYQLGNHVYSSYLLLIALFLLAHDTPRLYRLLVVRKQAAADKFQPRFLTAASRRARLILKSAFLFFVAVFAFQTYRAYHQDNYPYPNTAGGLKDGYGFYNVKEFRINNQVLPYSFTDSLRWQNVVVEKWNTISIKSNRPVLADFATPSVAAITDSERNYESAGVTGRRYYTYAADTLSKKIYLLNKNKNHVDDKLEFSYQRPDSSTIILSGKNGKQDSLYIVLEKINKRYLLKEGRRKPIKI